MKRSLISVTALLFMSLYLLSGLSFAQVKDDNSIKTNKSYMKMGKKCGMCSKMDKGSMGGQNMMKQISDEEAKTLFNNYLSNLKGYTLVSTNKYKTRKGVVYSADIKDSSSNLFRLTVDPMGKLKGPNLLTTVN